MKITYNWLKEFVKTDLPVKDMAVQLTLTGPEVAAVKTVGISKENEDKITLVKIGDISAHPKADNLRIVKCHDHKGEYRIITNSKTVEKGDYVLAALAGAKLPNGMEIKPVELRGEKSEGMFLGKDALNLEEKSGDVWRLGHDEKKAKSVVHEYTKEDYALEIELTSNRSDCLSVIGLAREVGAMTNKEMKIPEIKVVENTEEIPDIEIKDENLCPRYSARILRDVQIVESPDWIKRKLELCGIRPINNVVDATNYVLLEYGHPMHSFDLDRLEGKKIIVRKASQNEVFKTLDGQDRTLTDKMLVICDAKKAVALAGIMGGENSEIKPDTKNILLESAYFDPVSIRTTSKKVGIKTESSYRFERTADWGITTTALDRCAELILQTSPDSKVSKMRDEYVSIIKDAVINIKADYVSSRLGVKLSLKEVESILKRLKFTIISSREGVLEVKVPTFRSDISKPVDLVEEVARIYGYNNIPQNMYKPPVDVESLQPKKDINAKFREVLNAQGFTEAYNFSFTSAEELDKCLAMEDTVLPLANPLSSDASHMRNYLFLGLLRTVDYNVKSAYRNDLKFFEIGRTFRKKGKEYIEKQKIGLALYGEKYDYYTATGIAELLLGKAGDKKIVYRKASHPFLHPVNSAVLTFDGKEIGFVGEVHPDITNGLGLRGPVYTAELETLLLQEYLNAPLEMKTFGKFPPSTRDISIVVNRSVLGRDVMNDIAAFHPWIAKVDFVDLFRSQNIGESNNSLTFAISFQTDERTLTDKDVNDIMEKLLSDLKTRYGAELRS